MSRYVSRPYKHTITAAGGMGETVVIHLGSYATLGAAIRAAQKADAAVPNETRTITWRNWSARNRYAHGPVAAWRDDVEVSP